MTLLQQMHIEHRQRRETLRLETKRRLRAILEDLAPAKRVVVFGSLLQPNRFSEASDVDIALDSQPIWMSIYQLIALLSERLGRSVDVVVLPECRFRDRVMREGETWTLRD
jgi:predicted nucleotidyltransferase